MTDKKTADYSVDKHAGDNFYYVRYYIDDFNYRIACTYTKLGAYYQIHKHRKKLEAEKSGRNLVEYYR